MKQFDALDSRIRNYETPSITLIQDRKKDVTTLFNRMSKLHIQLSVATPPKDTASPDVYDPLLFDELQDKFFDLNDILSKLEEEASISREKSVVPINVPTAPKSQFKLPQIVIPTFSGEHEKWIPFRNLFSSLINSRTDLTSAEKLHYLQTSLTSEALILATSVTEDPDFDNIWKQLKERYDNSWHLVSTSLKSIIEFKPTFHDLNANLRKLRDTVLTALATVQSLKRPVQHWDDWLVVLITSKFDRVSLMQWNLKIGDSKNLPTYQEILSFIETRIRITEHEPAKNKVETKSSSAFSVGQSNLHSHQASKSKFSFPDQLTKSKTPSQPKPCYFYQGPHSIYLCKNSKTCPSLKDEPSPPPLIFARLV